jgi:L-serine dehydratase
VLPRHSNGLRFTALGEKERAAGPHVPVAGKVLLREDFYSIGGGFIVRGDEPEQAAGGAEIVLPHPFDSGEELLRRAADAELSIPALMLENEKAWRSEPDIRSGLLRIWK